QRARESERMDLRAPQRLVDVDVAEPCHGALVEQGRLDRGAAPCQALGEAARGERAAERFHAEPRVEVGLELSGLEQLPGAEAAHVAVGDIGSVVERDDRASVCVVGQSVRRGPKAPGHSEVDQESPAGLEPDDQILPSALERRHSLSLELDGHLDRLERTHQARVVDLDFGERAADQMRLELDPDRLDFRKLGHQSIVSRTIVLAGGASPPSSYAASTSASARFADASSRACTSASTSPTATSSPRFFRQRIPTAWSMVSSFVCRPAPRRSAAMPMSTAPIERTKPSALARTSVTTGALGSAVSAGSPPCAAIQRS